MLNIYDVAIKNNLGCVNENNWVPSFYGVAVYKSVLKRNKLYMKLEF